jgi:hypothetical protein
MTWWHILVAILLALAIWRIGIGVLRAVSSKPPRPEEQRSEPEDVEGLDVFLVCGECGTEFRVTRLGQLQVPRHCGEPMQVVRRDQTPPGGPDPS